MNLYKRIRSKAGMFVSAFIAQLLMMQNALAAFAEPSAGDMSRQFIGQIFGSLVGGGTDAFGASIEAFNGGVLIVGGILVAYTIFAGTLGTAHDGEMLGKKFSSVWVPIRTALGTALILPVLPGGYCVMQGIVMWLVMQGAGLANLVWNNYMSSPPALSGKVGMVAENKIRQFVEDVYLANVCVASLKQAVTDSPSYFKTYNYDVRDSVYIDGRKAWSFGDFGGVIPNPTLCGYLVAPKKPEIPVSSSVATSLSSLSAIKDSFKSPDLTPVYNAHITQITSIVTQTKALAELAIKDKTAVTGSQLDALVTAYKSAVEGAASGAMGSTGIADAAKTQGWFLAGTWATKIIFIQNKLNTAVASTGTINSSSVDMKDALSEEAVKYSNNGMFVLADRRPELSSQLNRQSDKNKENSGSNVQGLSMGGKIANALTSAITGIDFANIKNDNRHPLVLMNQIGERIFSGILIGMGAAAAVGTVAGIKVLGTGADFTPAFIAVFGTLGLPLSGLLGIAGMLAYIIPNMPFLLWLGIIIGWTLMVVEAVLAAPLWAVMHLHPNGADMTGRGGNGYMLVLGLLLRPTLIIFGLIGAIVFSEVFGKLINIIFFDLFTSNTMDGEVGFFGVLFGTGLYASTMFIVIKNTFAVMHQIPDQLMRWAGGGGEQLGQYANQMSEGAVAKGAAITGGVLGAGVMKTAGAIGGAKQQVSGMIEKQENKNAAKLEKEQLSSEKSMEAQEKESGQVSDANSSMSTSLGGEAPSIINSALSGGNGSASSSQLNSSQALGMKMDLSNANNALGGKDSPAATSFRENMARDIQNGATFDQAFSKNMPSALDQAYGSGAGRFADKATQGTFKGSEMAGVVAGMQNIQSLYSGVAGQESKQSSAINSATAHMKMGSSPSEAMNKVVDTIINKSSSANVSGFSSLGGGSSQPSPSKAD